MIYEEMLMEVQSIYEKADKAKKEYDDIHTKYVEKLKEQYEDIKGELKSLYKLALDLRIIKDGYPDYYYDLKNHGYNTYNFAGIGIYINKKVGYLALQDNNYDNKRDCSYCIGENNIDAEVYEKFITEWDGSIIDDIQQDMFKKAIEQATTSLNKNLQKLKTETDKYNTL